MCTIDDLPDEVLLAIFDRLDCGDLYAGAGIVSVHWRNVAGDVIARAEPVCARRARAADPGGVDYVGPFIASVIGQADADWRLYAHDAQCRWRAHACIRAARQDRIAILDVLCRMLAHPWVPGACIEAASHGRLGVLAYAATHRRPYDRAACESAAAAAKQHVVLDWLWDAQPPTRDSADRAAESGDIALLRLLQARRCSRGKSTMAAAARGGHVDVVRWLMRHRCPWDDTAILAAARAGNRDVLGLLLAQRDGRLLPETVEAAVVGGDTDCLDLLWARCVAVGRTDSDSKLAVAIPCRPGRRGVGATDETPQKAGTDDNIVALYGSHWVALAARHKDTAVLDWLCSRGCAPTPDAMAVAAAAGNLDALDCLRRRGCMWGAQTTAAAAAHGRLDMLDHLYRQGCPWDATTCTAAAASGHIECLAYARDRGCPWDSRVYVAAVQCGHVRVIEYAHENGCPHGRAVCEAASATVAAKGTLLADAVQFVQREVCRHRAGRCSLKPKARRHRTRSPSLQSQRKAACLLS
ncbi:Ankyrin repeat domain containing protein [Pandoravirus salinus]|uniref:Ankyrin repeat domain containing protein n=1 Tax=Pandoravirus salinus TaxID=1349410 RepID=A0A291AU32_9VIRU|nr:ankyrin repeat domain [Pandoravirus salinus]ATE82299.1 Ankyrin repeat domain containing protein [Pandoravirus salinus]